MLMMKDIFIYGKIYLQLKELIKKIKIMDWIKSEDDKILLKKIK